MARQTRLGTSLAVGQSLARTVFGVGFRRETYVNLVYLLARFPLGVAYFTVIVTGFALGFGLLPVVVGLPILVGVLALGGYVGVVEATLLDRLLGRDVSYDPVAPRDQSVPASLRAVVTDPGSYVLTAFGLASFAAGVALLVGVTLAFSVGVTLLAAPLLYWVAGVEYGLPRLADLGVVVVDIGGLAGSSIDTLPEALVASVLGAAVCLGGLHAVNLTARVVAGLCERLLRALPE